MKHKSKAKQNMRLRTIGTAHVYDLCISGNRCSDFSHQGPEHNQEMLNHHTPERIHEVLRDAWSSSGNIQWFAQTCIERGDPDAWRKDDPNMIAQDVRFFDEYVDAVPAEEMA